MTPDLSSPATSAMSHSFQKHSRETPDPLLPRVNIDSSDATPAQHTSLLHGRSTIDTINRSSFRRLIPKCLRLHYGLRENERQIDRCRNGFQPYGAQDNPLVTYENNKVLFRSLESFTADNLGVPISRHNNSRYTALKGSLEEQTQKINTLLTENLNCAVESFSSLNCLLNFIDSELSEFITLPHTLNSLLSSMKKLLDQDQHCGNTETLQLVQKLTLSIEQKIRSEHNNSAFYCSLKSSLKDMTVEILGRHLNKLNSVELLANFIESHSRNIRNLSDHHPALIQHMIRRIDRLPKELVTAEALFSLHMKLQFVFKDPTKEILKKAFSVQLNESNSLNSIRTAFIKANRIGLSRDDITQRLFSKMCSFITKFDDALSTFNQVTASTTSINWNSLKTLYEKVVTFADSADHFYRLTKNPSFRKDISIFCLNGLTKDPNHIQLKQVHARIIEEKITEQFNKAIDRSRKDFVFNCKSEINRIIQSQEDKYQQQFSDRITTPKELFNKKNQTAAREFVKAEEYFGKIRSHSDSCKKTFNKHFDNAVKSALDALMAAPTESMRKESENLINSYFRKGHRMRNGRIKYFSMPTQLANIIKKIKSQQSLESTFLERKETAIESLKKNLEMQKLKKTNDFDNSTRRKRKKLDSSLQDIQPKLHNYYSSLSEIKPTTPQYFLLDNFRMPYLYCALFLIQESHFNMDDQYIFDLSDVPGDLSSSTFTENISVADSGFLADIDIGDLSFDTSLPFNMNHDLDIDLAAACDLSADLAAEMNLSTNFGSDITHGCDFSSPEPSYGGGYSGGGYSGGGYSGGGYDGGGSSGGCDSGGGGGCDGGGF